MNHEKVLYHLYNRSNIHVICGDQNHFNYYYLYIREILKFHFIKSKMDIGSDQVFR